MPACGAIVAIQQWTIIKLVGPAAADAVHRVDRWWSARRSHDKACFALSDWPASTRKSAANYLSRLVEHRCEMPTAYFSQHVDLWLGGGQVQHHLAGVQTRIWHNGGELWCYPLPDRGKLIRRNASIERSAKFAESQWLACRLIEAVRAYEKLWSEATLLINRETISVSPSDESLTTAAAVWPRWLSPTRRLNRRPQRR